MNREIGPIAVVGGGYMGGGIAQTFALAGHKVRVADRDAETAIASVQRLNGEAERFEQLGLMREGAAATIAANLEAANSIEEAVEGAGYVVEAVFENLDVKHETLRRISAVLRPDAVIGSNTSALPIESLAPAVADPTRFLGVHWFNPAPFVPGVELIPSSETAEESMVLAETLIDSLGKETARVSDTPGFVGNRLQFALFKEAVAILEEGTATVDQIDTVVRNTFGFRLSLFGPFAIGDMAGLDVYRAALGTLHQAYGERFAVPDSLNDLVESGRLGLKSGSGFHDFSEEERAELSAYRDRAYAHLSMLKTDLGPAPGL
jgi:3-hydroxybutyryl-CoA dehydrogenase